MNSLATLKLDLARVRETMNAGQWTAAETMLRAMLAQDPQNAVTLRMLASVVRQLGRTNLAIELGNLR